MVIHANANANDPLFSHTQNNDRLMLCFDNQTGLSTEKTFKHLKVKGYYLRDYVLSCFVLPKYHPFFNMSFRW